MTTRPSKIDSALGAVLAGGSSRRMGRDKALMEIGGQTLLRRAVGALQPVLSEVVIVASRQRGYADLGVPVVSDIRPNLGPVGGLHTSLVHGAGRAVFVLACDMPFVPPDLVRWIGDISLSELGSQQAFARVVRDSNGAQPLCGLYSAGCLPPVQRALDEGRLSAQALLSDLDTEYLELDTSAGWYRSRLLANINDLEDLAAHAERT